MSPRGSVFYDLHGKRPYLLDVFSAAIKDGRGNPLHRRLFVVQTEPDGTLTIKQPTVFLDLQSLRHAEVAEAYEKAPEVPLNAANLKQSEDRLDELNGRLERRREELQQEGQCAIGDIRHVGRAWVLPHPEDPKTAIEVRFVEVKGRAGVGEVALSSNEYKTAERLEAGRPCGAGPGPARLGADCEDRALPH